MPEYTLPAAMVISLLAGIFTGYRVAFLLGGLGILFSYIGDIRFVSWGWCIPHLFQRGGKLAAYCNPAIHLHGPDAGAFRVGEQSAGVA